MACDNGAQTGAELVIEVGFDCPSTDPTTVTFLEVGMVRSKSFSTSIDTIDVTADKSAGDRRTFIPSYKTDTIDMDGISYADVIYNQKAFRNHVKFGDPASATAGEPYGWIKITHPVYQQVEYYPVIFSNWEDTGTYDDAITWSVSATSAGAPTFEDVTP